ncbi:hypothetical protein WB44_01170 [Synechococcus sp. WH 8020]|nr:hypothetical protein WB44_01170 [Synechococcus sp. WH 8020]
MYEPTINPSHNFDSTLQALQEILILLVGDQNAWRIARKTESRFLLVRNQLQKLGNTPGQIQRHR